MNLVMSISDHVNVLSFGRKIADGAPADVQRRPGGDRGVPRRGRGRRRARPSRVRPRRGRDGASDRAPRARGVQARYGPVQALHDVSLTVDEGEVVAVLGANGAGKTTTLRAISGTVQRSGSLELERQRPPRRARDGRAGGNRARARGPRDVRRAHRGREPPPRRLHAARPAGEGRHAAGRRVLPLDGGARRASARGRSPAASSRCSRSVARS